MGRVCHGPSLLWAEMSRNHQRFTNFSMKLQTLITKITGKTRAEGNNKPFWLSKFLEDYNEDHKRCPQSFTCIQFRFRVSVNAFSDRTRYFPCLFLAGSF